MRIKNRANKGQGLIELTVALSVIGIVSIVLIHVRLQGDVTASGAENRNELENLRTVIRQMMSCSETLREQQGKCDEGRPIELLSGQGTQLAAEHSGAALQYGYDLTASCLRVRTENRITVMVSTELRNAGTRVVSPLPRPLFDVPIVCATVRPTCTAEVTSFSGVFRQKSFFGETIDAMPAPNCGAFLYVIGHFIWYDSMAKPRVNKILRLLPDGTIDLEFNTGTAFTNNGAYGLAPAGDGTTDIYAVGPFNEWQGVPTSHVIRLNASGMKDATFSTGGGFDRAPNIAAPVPNGMGKVYVGGEFTLYYRETPEQPIRYVARLNRDGTLDTSFNPQLNFIGGPSILALLPISSGVHAGKIYVAGTLTVQQGGVEYRSVIRLNPDGTLDPSFRVTTLENVYTLEQTSSGDGEIVVGSDTWGARLVKLNDSGALALGFQTDTLKGQVSNVKLSRLDNKFYVTGEFNWTVNGQIYGAGIARINSDGSRDMTFDLMGSGIGGGTRVLSPMTNGLVYVGGSLNLLLNGNGTTQGLMALTGSGRYALDAFAN